MKDTPVIIINGPRQAGKTTLVQTYASALQYITLDDDNMLNAAQQDPIGFIKRIEQGAIIDEIQRSPELLRAIKLSVDRNRQPGRFLLTGSTNLLALPNIGDSLAGRMEILTLLPLSLAEMEERDNRFLTLAQTQGWPISAQNPSFNPISHALMGGYPEMLIRQEPHRRSAWARSYIKAIVERDIKDISSVEKLAEMPYLLEVLGQQSGQLTNFTQIGGQIHLDTKTTQKYISLLENLFLVKLLRPWHRNTLSRMIKTPKIHFLDSGLLASLNRITRERLDTNRTLLGALLETWVYGELLKTINDQQGLWEIFYYRDKDKIEVDFILENAANKIVGIEVKASSTVLNQDFRGLRKLSSLLGSDFISGIVLYNGDQCLSFGNALWAIPLSLLD